MEDQLGFLGNAARDLYFADALISHGTGHVGIEYDGSSYVLRPRGRVAPGLKVTVDDLPAGLVAAAPRADYGGGALNSLRAFTLLAPAQRAQYLDTAAEDPHLKRTIRSEAVQVDFLGLRQMPVNAVLWWEGDRVIFKSPLEAAGELDDHQKSRLARLASCQAVLVNSVKDAAVLEFLIRLGAGQRPRLHVVATESLPAVFVRERVLPAASAVICNWQEVHHLIGRPGVQTVSAAQGALIWLREHAPQASLFLTMGKEGVLVAAPGDNAVAHVRLGPTQTEQLQRQLRGYPWRVCGCGDAFASGAFTRLETGRTAVLGGDSGGVVYSAALAGCAAAVQWLGWEPRLREQDFHVERFPLSRESVFRAVYQ